MKSIIIALLFINASYGTAETVVVTRSYLPSSPDPCFSVRKDGKPISNIPVELYQSGTSFRESPYWKSSTNSEGLACSLTLPDGKYEVYANLGRRNSEVDIEVNEKNEVSGFQLALMLPHRLQSAVQAPTRVWLQQLRGVVEDPSGAVIPKVKFEVWRKTSADNADENPVTKTESNERGEFTCELKPGAYVAIFEFPGFNLTAFPFEVDRKGWEGLRLTMQVGGSNSPPPRFGDLSAKN